ncbi:hypothetical protein RB195_021896 [Necator americanus]|uniref:Reverse transcriptase domain-containing protein n=1 Tax=Necator americanus TaxID=51031 RepID=A0ABR1EDD1_NECAM
MYKVLERIILDRLIKHSEETTLDEKAGRSTIDQVFIVRKVIEIWQRRQADIILAPSGHLLTDLQYAGDVVIFAESNTKLQHVVNLVWKLAAADGLRQRPDKCKQTWISSRPRTGIKVDAQPIELVETGRSPFSTNSEGFVGFELEEATWPQTEVLDQGGGRGPEDTRRG